MRIIGGEARGRRLFSPDGDETRPTSDKVREALFSIIARRVPDADVLDLFGGTGALALEAMSRGAQRAVICDVSGKAGECIKRNIEAVMKGCEGVSFLKADYRKALESLKGRTFDIVFLDPPYRLSDAYADCARRLADGRLLKEDALIVAERAVQTQVNWPDGFTLRDKRVYRDTALDFVSMEDMP